MASTAINCSALAANSSHPSVYTQPDRLSPNHPMAEAVNQVCQLSNLVLAMQKNQVFPALADFFYDSISQEDTINHQAQEIQNLKAMAQDHRQRMAAQTNQLEDVMRSLTSSERQNSLLRSDNDMLTARIHELEVRILSADAQIQETQLALREKDAALHEADANLKQARKAAAEKTAIAQAELEAVERALKVRLHEIESRMRETQQDVDVRSRELQEARSEVVERQSAFNNVSNQMALCRAEMTILEAKYDDMRQTFGSTSLTKLDDVAKSAVRKDLESLWKDARGFIHEHINPQMSASHAADITAHARKHKIPHPETSSAPAAAMRQALGFATLSHALIKYIFRPLWLTPAAQAAADTLVEALPGAETLPRVLRATVLPAARADAAAREALVRDACQYALDRLRPLVGDGVARADKGLHAFFARAVEVWLLTQTSRELVATQTLAEYARAGTPRASADALRLCSLFDTADADAARATAASVSSAGSLPPPLPKLPALSRSSQQSSRDDGKPIALLFPRIVVAETGEVVHAGIALWSEQDTVVAALEELAAPRDGARKVTFAAEERAGRSDRRSPEGGHRRRRSVSSSHAGAGYTVASGRAPGAAAQYVPAYPPSSSPVYTAQGVVPFVGQQNPAFLQAGPAYQGGVGRSPSRSRSRSGSAVPGEGSRSGSRNSHSRSRTAESRGSGHGHGTSKLHS